jgi:hypothetical protein
MHINPGIFSPVATLIRTPGAKDRLENEEREADVTTAVAPAPLTAEDRCDRCGAQAYLRVELASGELLFCAHHAREHGDALKAIAISFQDETHKLSDKPAPVND